MVLTYSLIIAACSYAGYKLTKSMLNDLLILMGEKPGPKK